MRRRDWKTHTHTQANQKPRDEKVFQMKSMLGGFTAD